MRFRECFFENKFVPLAADMQKNHKNTYIIA